MEQSVNLPLKAERQSNFELLRIISMLMIMLHHCVGYSNFDFEAMGISGWALQCIGAFGKVGALCFVMITGYFMCSSAISFIKIFKLWFDAVFYGSLMYIVISFLVKWKIDFKYFLGDFFPLTYDRYWFLTAFVLLYLTIPFLNKAMQSLKKRQIVVLIIALLLINQALLVIDAYTLFHYAVWFAAMYLIGAFIKKYETDKLLCSSMLPLIGFVVSSSATFALLYFSYFKLSFGESVISRWWSLTGLMMPNILLMAIFLFLMFKNIKIKNSKLINTVSASTFAVYLIHDCQYARIPFWRMILRLSHIKNHLVLFPAVFITVLIIFAICVIIDQLKLRFIDKPLLGRLSKLGFMVEKIR